MKYEIIQNNMKYYETIQNTMKSKIWNNTKYTKW
jgi:hypothetical protein